MNHLSIKQYELGPMNNYIYFLEDQEAKEVFIVDPAWDVPFIKDQLEKGENQLKGLLITHVHPDHTNGIFDLLKSYDVPVYVSREEKSFYGDISENLHPVIPGEELLLGKIPVQCLHTPGHSPGSQCFKVGNSLVSGDTLFLDACGRCDLPGGDVETLYDSLYNVIYSLPDSTVLYPGHNYHHLKTDTLSQQKKTNPYLRCHSLKDFVSQRLP